MGVVDEVVAEVGEKVGTVVEVLGDVEESEMSVLMGNEFGESVEYPLCVEVEGVLVAVGPDPGRVAPSVPVLVELVLVIGTVIVDMVAASFELVLVLVLSSVDVIGVMDSVAVTDDMNTVEVSIVGPAVMSTSTVLVIVLVLSVLETVLVIVLVLSVLGTVLVIVLGTVTVEVVALEESGSVIGFV